MTNQPWGQQQRPPYPHHTQPLPPVQPPMYANPPARRRRLGVAGIIGITFGVLLISCCGIGAIGAALSDGPKPLASASTGTPEAPADSPSAVPADVDSATPTDDTSTTAGATPTTAGPTTAGQVKTTPRPTQTTPRPKQTTAQPKRTTAAPRTTKPTTDSVQQGVHPGAFCKTAGAMGKTKTGKLMQCKKTAEDPALRWRAA
ncbi:hypothetical protein [Polymorphospora rubra]|uniref:Uncharacterized protein n=1 Tax=Polymorphospora rubra TaxID=338584 RepID=A0A810MW60_9ACTN|nr:hypothetical protein [Polymorphospora rubra]BCJ64774.1 hypothetical protein Prubr_17950 [Polymorphospora rubra]